MTDAESDEIGGRGAGRRTFPQPMLCGNGHRIETGVLLPYVARGWTAVEGVCEPVYRCPQCRAWWGLSIWRVAPLAQPEEMADLPLVEQCEHQKRKIEALQAENERLRAEAERFRRYALVEDPP